MSIARLYNFSPNTTIFSAEVNAELNQLVSEVNLMFKKDASDSITGDVTIAKSIPSLIFGGSETNAKFFKIKENAGVASFQFDNSGYTSFLELDNTNNQVKFIKEAVAYGNIIGDTTDLRSLGSTTKAFKELVLNNGATDGGAVYFDADTTACLKALADGTQLQLGAKFTSFVPDASGGASLGTSALPFSHLTLSTNIGTSTPVAKRLYSDLIPKAWARTSSAGSLTAGVNLTVTSGATGTYTYTFRTAMANANYSVIATAKSSLGVNYRVVGLSSVVVPTTTGFTIVIYDSAGSATDAEHHLIVIGAQ